MKLNHVLSRTASVTIYLDHYNANDLKRAARFWIGKEASTLRKDECIAALEKAFKDKLPTRNVLLSLSEKQRQLLSIFARYGTTVSGALLSAELHGRGLVEKKDKKDLYYYHGRDDVVTELCNKMVLVGSGGGSYYYFDRRYPTLTLHPSIAASVQPATPLRWEPSEACPPAKTGYRRSSAEVALDLWQVAAGLREMGNWKTVKGNALSKGSRNRLRKLVPLDPAEKDPLSPPDPESLYYELLQGMGCLSLRADSCDVLDDRLEDHMQQPAAVQAWHWVRAWLEMGLWQDGIGVVPDRDNEHDPVRIEPSGLRKARELLVWALCLVAHGADAWLDLETFLKDLWQATRDDEIDFYWSHYTWHPGFDMARRKNSFPSGDDRSFAFWLDEEGMWVSNAVMVTLVTLGLVERGRSTEKKGRPCFRLTELGRAVFGAPEVEIAARGQDTPFLVVQPNLEVQAYMDQAEADQICTLARFAARTSAAGGRVQTFALQRESIYKALESGMTLEAIESFLAQHSRTALSDNVVRILSEWAGKRESLVLRSQVTLACGAGFQPAHKGRNLDDGMVLLPKMSRNKAVKDYPGWTVLDHQGELPQTWKAKELGEIRTNDADSISQTRLSYIAERSQNTWQVTERSIAGARQHGLTADQIIGWLRDHLTHDLPPVLEMAIRNWTGHASVFAGTVQLLQVTRPQAREAILGSPMFEPLLVGHIPPDWFVVRDEKAAELKQLLKKLGFSISASYQLPSLDESRKHREGG